MLFYKDRLVEIYHGDCREIVSRYPNALVVTDPPYNIGYHYDSYSDNMDDVGYKTMLQQTCRLPSVVIHYSESLCELSWVLSSIPKKIVAWVYPSNTQRQWRGVAWFGCKPDFKKDGQPYKNPKDKRVMKLIEAGRQARIYDWWEIHQVKNVSYQKTEHPCQIPEEVMTRILKITDCEMIIDPFCGSGTTLAAAKRIGVPCIGIERNEKYCAISASRVAEIP